MPKPSARVLHEMSAFIDDVNRNMNNRKEFIDDPEVFVQDNYPDLANYVNGRSPAKKRPDWVGLQNDLKIANSKASQVASNIQDGDETPGNVPDDLMW